MPHTITVLPGDGIGPEVMDVALEFLAADPTKRLDRVLDPTIHLMAR
jgi:isocitrate/isopropylmalate dehydrogenase